MSELLRPKNIGSLVLSRRLVVESPHKPVPPWRVVINPVHTILRRRVCIFLAQASTRSEINRQIPFVLIPPIFLPPLPRTAPRARRRHHVSLHSREANAHGPRFTDFHTRRDGRTHHSESRGYLARFPRFVIVTRRRIFLAVFACLFLRRIRAAGPTCHPKIFRSMGIQYFGYANIGFSYQ